MEIRRVYFQGVRSVTLASSLAKGTGCGFIHPHTSMETTIRTKTIPTKWNWPIAAAHSLTGETKYPRPLRIIPRIRIVFAATAGTLLVFIATITTANNGINGNYACIDITPDQPLSITINLDSLFEVSDDIAIYPIKLKNIAFSMNKKADKKEYNIPFEGIYLHYGKQVTTDLECPTSPQAPASNAQKMLRNGQLIIIKNNKTYNILGHEITEKH